MTTAKRKLTEREQLQLQSDREMPVYKRDDMIQKARFTLTLQEQESYDANNSQKPFSPKTFLA